MKKTNKLMKSLLLPIVLVAVCFKAYPQGNGLNEVIEVNKSYKPKLSDAVKIDVIPQSETPDIQKPKIDYKVSSEVLKMQPYKTVLKAPSIGKPKIDELHKGYAKLGFGNYSNIIGEVWFSTLRNRTSLVSGHYLHHSGNAGIKNSGFDNELVDLFGKRIFGKNELLADAGYSLRSNHYYGIPDSLKDDSTFRNVPKQRFNNLELGLAFTNSGADTGSLRYNAGIRYYNFSDIFKTKENDVTLSAGIDEPFRGNHINAGVSFDYISYDSLTRTLFQADAHYRFIKNGLRASIGFKSANESGTSPGFHLYPDVIVNADLIPKYLTLYGGITGGLQKNTFRSYSLENPFIKTAPDVRNTNNKFEFFGGAKGSFSNYSSFRLAVSYKNLKNQYFFVNDSTDPRKFIPLYDSGTSLLNLHAELGLSPMENLSFNTKLDLFRYGLSTLPEPFHRPGLQWMLTGKYSIEDKIDITGDVFVIGARKAEILGSKEIVALKPVVDLNAGASYSFSTIKGLKAFIQFNNILGKKYTLWNYYPARGLQVTAGAILTFL